MCPTVLLFRSMRMRRMRMCTSWTMTTWRLCTPCSRFVQLIQEHCSLFNLSARARSGPVNHEELKLFVFLLWSSSFIFTILISCAESERKGEDSWLVPHRTQAPLQRHQDKRYNQEVLPRICSRHHRC